MVRAFEIEEFQAKADARLNNPDNHQGFEHFPLTSQFQSSSGIQDCGLAGADETASVGKIRGDASHLLAAFEINDLRIGSERVTDRVTPVSNTAEACVRVRGAAWHRDNFRHEKLSTWI